MEANGYFHGSVVAKVFRSILDDERWIDRKVEILRYVNINKELAENVVNFCISQLDKPYCLDFSHDFSSNKSGWYCSLLVWAGYKNFGVDLETTAWIQDPGVSPRDIKYSGKVIRVI
ncbi:YiiX/YebB-like N1pC/P60 family cysteine hydrolase [Enterococcus faecalis]|nr:hypothetical protein [Enterococcus faecalis]ELT8948106.1 hypothetical protein [Enterococcus faecalis]